MWPSKRGLGVQLGHGLHGSSLYSGNLDESQTWTSARERESGLKLAKISNSLRTLVQPQMAKVQVSSSKDTLLKDAMLYVSGTISKNLDQEERLFDSEFIYDPVGGNMIDCGKLGKPKKQYYIAYASDVSQCVLNVHALAFKEELLNTNDQDFLQRIEVPTLGNFASIDLSTPIRQVLIPKSSSVFPAFPSQIFVRTSESICIIRVHSRGEMHKLENYRSFDIEDLAGHPFADIASSPYDFSQIAVIDVKGNWAVVSIKEAQQAKILYKGTIFDSEEMSNFKRISWTDHWNSIIVCGRLFVKEITLDTNDIIDLISSCSFSRVRDYQKLDLDDDYAFLLTSRELIWVNVKNHFKRILSWKHNLDPEDPSLSMKIRNIGETIFILLFSQLHPLVFLFQFRLEDGYPKSKHDPIMIKTDSSTTALSYLLLPARFDSLCFTDSNFIKNDHKEKQFKGQKNSFFCLFKISNQLELTSLLLSTIGICRMVKYRKDSKPLKRAQKEKNTATIQTFKKNNRLSVLTEVPKIFEIFPAFISNSDRQLEDSEIFQRYAFSLNVDNFKNTSPRSLLEAAIPVEDFEGFDEFGSMLTQLKQYCEADPNLSFIAFGDLIGHIQQGENNLRTCKDFFSSLCELWVSNVNDKFDIFFPKYVTRDLVLSLSIIYNKGKEEEEFVRKRDKLPQKLKSLILSWDDEYVADDDHNSSNYYNNVPTNEEFHEPSIALSQPSRVTNAYKTGEYYSSQAPQAHSSLRSSQIWPSQSQSTQSTQHKKKKKKQRIVGFG